MVRILRPPPTLTLEALADSLVRKVHRGDLHPNEIVYLKKIGHLTVNGRQIIGYVTLAMKVDFLKDVSGQSRASILGESALHQPPRSEPYPTLEVLYDHSQPPIDTIEQSPIHSREFLPTEPLLKE